MTAVPRQEKSPPARQRDAKRPHAREGLGSAAWRTIGFCCQTTLGLGLISGVLMWLAFPPIGLAPAVWIAPVGLLLLIRQSNLQGRHPYRTLYLAGFLSWLPLMHWLRLPHWAGYFSWPGATAVLACYFPLFVGLSRVLVHRWRTSIVLTAPVVWTGLELLRAHFPHGFTMASLGHAHYQWLQLIQISDVAGGYAVSFVIMLVAACAARMIPWNGRKAVLWPVLPAVIVLSATLAYGHYRLAAFATATRARPLQVGIIQGSFDTTFQPDPERPRRIYDAMKRLTVQALQQRPDLDLIVWPETMLHLLKVEHEFYGPFRSNIADEVNGELSTRAWFLVGADLEHRRELEDRDNAENYNAALFFDSSGMLLDRYDKMNPIWFGEYIPLGDHLPWLYRFSPLRDGLKAGARPAAFELKGVRFCPSVCYESILPHHVRRSIATLRAEGREPHVLVNLTNSGWFWGSSELDLHLICNVFRAVECKKPMLVAANTGISAWIDGSGRIVARGPKRDEATIIAEVGASDLQSVYSSLGDWPAGLCLLVCFGAVGHMLITWRRGKPASPGRAP